MLIERSLLLLNGLVTKVAMKRDREGFRRATARGRKEKAARSIQSVSPPQHGWFEVAHRAGPCSSASTRLSCVDRT